MLILAIETSCDDTASSVIQANNGKIAALSSVVSSQTKLHTEWGGVVPNLAAREHVKNIIPVVEASLKEAKVKPHELDLITVTSGPGLIPALLVGVNTAKTLSYVWNKPLCGIHHIEGHIYANFLSVDSIEEIKFPAICLVISGGHTQLVYMQDHLDYFIAGETLDDAAGEAFDKVARILGLGYPGGPAIAEKAEIYQKKLDSAKEDRKEKAGYGINLPRPMLHSSNLNFSFSGLKTAVLYAVKKNEKLLEDKKFVAQMCYEFQQATIDVLIHKTIRAAKKYKPRTIMLAGGVSANVELRQQLGEKIKEELPLTAYFLPELKYSIDNAAMIATAGYFRCQKDTIRFKENWKKLQADANLKLK